MSNHMICSALQEFPCFKILMTTNCDFFQSELHEKGNHLSLHTKHSGSRKDRVRSLTLV